MKRAAWCVAALLAACAGELPPPTEQDVHDALARDFLVPMGDVLVAGWPSDCRTGGETDAPVEAELFHAFLRANADEETESPNLAPSLRLDASGQHPRSVRAERAEPVVAVSRVGMVGDAALVCVEVFGVQERAFFVLLRRTPAGDWAVQTEIEVWAELRPEELPDGELYQ